MQIMETTLEKQQQEQLAIKTSLDFSIKDGVAFAAMSGFGDNYINPFAVAMNATNHQIGILTALTQIIPALIQLKAADITDRVGSRKKIIVRTIFLQASMLLPIALIPYLPGFMQIIALSSFCTFYTSFGSFANPPWGSLMASLVPGERRGTFFSKRSRLISTVTLATMFLAGYILYLFPKQSLAGFTLIFLIAMVARYISCYFLHKMYEPLLEIKKEHYFSLVEFVRRLNVGNFGRYVTFHSFFNLATFIASPFFPMFMLRDLDLSYLSYTIIITTVPLAIVLSLGFWGRYADSSGNRRVIRICSIGISTLPALWLISHHVYFLIGIQALGGMFWGGFNLCSSNFVYDSAIPEKRTRCIAYLNAFNGVALCIGSLLGGILSTRLPHLFGYQLHTLFVISSFLRIIVAVILFRRVKEIRKIAH